MRPEPEPLTLPLVSASRASDAPEEPIASANGQAGAPADGEQDERAGDDCCILCTPGVNTPGPNTPGMPLCSTMNDGCRILCTPGVNTMQG